MPRHLLVVVASLALVGSAVFAQSSRVTGTISYRERILLQPNAVVEVSLEDVSRADGPAVVIASARLEQPGQVPIAFGLSYNPARIEDHHRYAVRARILEGARVRFATTESALVITQGHGQQVSLMLSGVAAPAASAAPAQTAPMAPPPAPLAPPVPLTNLPATFVGTLPCADCAGIRYQLNLFADDSSFLRTTYLGRPSASGRDEIGSWVLSSDRRVLALQGGRDGAEFFSIRDALSLRKLDLEGREISSALPFDLRRTSPWQPLDVRLEMRGVYRLTADGAEFTECSTGQRWPVSGDASRQDLDSRYRASVKKPGDPLVVSIDGRVSSKAAPASAVVLVAERVIAASSGATCAPRFASAPLANTYWKLTRLGDTIVGGASTQANEPALTFRAESSSFSGSDGCNRLAGIYRIAGDQISLTGVGTLMACRGATETAFTSALKTITRYRILGATMDLYDAQHHRIARLEARDSN